MQDGSGESEGQQPYFLLISVLSNLCRWMNNHDRSGDNLTVPLQRIQLKPSPTRRDLELIQWLSGLDVTGHMRQYGPLYNKVNYRCYAVLCLVTFES